MLLVVPHAARGCGGPDSFAHRLELRAQRVGVPAAGLNAGLASGPATMAPGGSLSHVGDGEQGSLLTYQEHGPAARCWEFRPNADPRPLGPLLALDGS